MWRKIQWLVSPLENLVLEKQPIDMINLLGKFIITDLHTFTLVLIDKEFYFKCRKVLCHCQENICMKI